MGKLRIDRVWDGSLTPLTVTRAGVTATVGLAREDWQAPMQVVCQRLTTALTNALPPGAGHWSVVVTTDNKISMALTGAVFSVVFQPGFAKFLGFSATTHTNNLMILSDTTPEYYRADCWVSYGLPVLYWHRANRGKHSVIWGSWYALDVAIVEPHPATPVWDPARCVFAVSGTPGITTPWSPSNRGGYLVLRPTAEDATTEWFDQTTGDWVQGKLRCVILTPGCDLC